MILPTKLREHSKTSNSKSNSSQIWQLLYQKMNSGQ
jgi:hypothetical protein